MQALRFFIFPPLCQPIVQKGRKMFTLYFHVIIFFVQKNHNFAQSKYN